ncbi:NfeD family protein [Saccharophagus degradans]|uniref:NfeD-like C-terminal domain-containing protein n=1 Tax=Saccharophagus degradans (strain 2-40 / ATCC 43961 / DSM 17024) TaxID=203122 RepID=Q21EU0_SACD2|nr:hypothetical protein [Saccharophagus degradans]ABD82789.1 conserved hypothetical protein [Saccharophagus degradans 2-40]
MSAFTELPVLLTIIGIVLLIVEFAVLGFSTLFLVFVACACFSTAILQLVGLLPENLLWSTISVGIQTAVFGVLLWKPLRKLQNIQQAEDDQPNDINGLEFRLSSNLSPTTPSQHNYSGISWVVELDGELDDEQSQELAQGTLVKVSRSSVGKLFVKPVK